MILVLVAFFYLCILSFSKIKFLFNLKFCICNLIKRTKEIQRQHNAKIGKLDMDINFKIRRMSTIKSFTPWYRFNFFLFLMKMINCIRHQKRKL